MDAAYHFLYLLKFGACITLGASIGTLFIDIDHFIPQVFKGEKVGYGVNPDSLWLHKIYWPLIVLGIALGIFFHLFIDVAQEHTRVWRLI
jgi:Na+-transporting NADH:ubiquinone oxidoreductase subunit NqrB